MSKKDNKYEVPLSIVVFFLILFVLFKHTYFMYIALGIGFFSLVSKFLAEKITFLWKKIMGAVGFVNAHVILSAIFFVFLTPLAVLFRLVKGDVLGLKKKDSSYYVERNHKYVARDLKNPW